MKISNISIANNFGAKLTKKAEFEYRLKYYRFPKTSSTAIRELKEAECDSVIVLGPRKLALGKNFDFVKYISKNVITSKFLKENMPSLLREALEEAADRGELHTVRDRFIDEFAHRADEIREISSDSKLIGLNEFAIECNEISSTKRW